VGGDRTAARRGAGGDQEQGLLRAPIRITEQYYHFADPDKSPMLGAFAPTDDAIGLLFGAKPPADEENKTLFIGCNYAPVTLKDFLAAARHRQQHARSRPI
jgi:hypothetical protein